MLAVDDPTGGEGIGEAGARGEDGGAAAAVAAHAAGVGEGDLGGGLVAVGPGDAVDGEAPSSAASPPPRRSARPRRRGGGPC